MIANSDEKCLGAYRFKMVRNKSDQTTEFVEKDTKLNDCLTRYSL